MTCLLRVNLDFDPRHPSLIRISQAASAIKWFRKFGGKIVLLSHRGNPKKSDGRLTLRPSGRLLSQKINRRIIFLPGFNFGEMAEKIKGSPADSIFLLENVRFLSGETSNSKTVSRALASLGDIYVNDDFSSSHREHASTCGIASFLASFPGPNLLAELKALNSALSSRHRPRILIVGGAKAEDKIKRLKKIIPRVDRVLLGGIPGNLFLREAGCRTKPLGGKKVVSLVRFLLKKYPRKIMMPFDYAVRKDDIFDIGSKTVVAYSKIIKEAKAIIWVGPLGVFEIKKFSAGTFSIAKAVADSKAFSIVGGGDTLRAIEEAGVSGKIDHLSPGGGAMLAYLSGEKMPGIEALVKNAKNKKYD